MVRILNLDDDSEKMTVFFNGKDYTVSSPRMGDAKKFMEIAAQIDGDDKSLIGESLERIAPYVLPDMPAEVVKTIQLSQFMKIIRTATQGMQDESKKN